MTHGEATNTQAKKNKLFRRAKQVAFVGMAVVGYVWVVSSATR